MAQTPPLPCHSPSDRPDVVPLTWNDWQAVLSSFHKMLPAESLDFSYKTYVALSMKAFGASFLGSARALPRSAQMKLVQYAFANWDGQAGATRDRDSSLTDFIFTTFATARPSDLYPDEATVEDLADNLPAAIFRTLKDPITWNCYQKAFRCLRDFWPPTASLDYSTFAATHSAKFPNHSIPHNMPATNEQVVLRALEHLRPNTVSQPTTEERGHRRAARHRLAVQNHLRSLVRTIRKSANHPSCTADTWKIFQTLETTTMKLQRAFTLLSAARRSRHRVHPRSLTNLRPLPRKRAQPGSPKDCPTHT